MIYSLIKKTSFDKLPERIKKQIVSVSTSPNVSSLLTTSLSANDYYVIESTMGDALLTELKNYNIYSESELRAIVKSGVYTEIEAPNRFDNDGKEVVRMSGIAEDNNRRVRHTGIMDSTIAPNTSKNIDWLMPQITHLGANVPSVFTGVKFKVCGGNDGDFLNFQIVDIDNLIGYGPGAVLDEFAKNWYVFPNEVETVREYKADIIPGLYIRAVYNNTGLSDARFICNILRYAVTP